MTGFTKKLRTTAVVSFMGAMATLLIGGYFASHELPPYPNKVTTSDGRVLFGKEQILRGQDVYQRYGLMDHGSVWGHGSQRGPEFSALTLQIIADTIKNEEAKRMYGKDYSNLSDTEKEITIVNARHHIKKNRYDKDKDILTLTNEQITALQMVLEYWDNVFSKGDQRYGILAESVPSKQDREDLAYFFFWTAWVASTTRPDSDYSYTNNWPPNIDAGNVPTIATYLMSIGGIFSLFVVLGFFIWFVHHYKLWYGEEKGGSLAEKLIKMPLTPSQEKAAKFFVVVVALFLIQTLIGGLLAHYTVSPASFYFDFVASVIPYSIAKTWHLQLAIFWIATTWVGSAIYLAPIMGGKEPKHQGLLVQILFIAVIIVAVGSLVGEYLGVTNKLGENLWYWFGHQGWEYLELGRIWQILLFVGLIAWLLIVYRPVASYLKQAQSEENRSLLWFYLFSAVLVVAFFGFGLFYGRGSHITLADYWRWFVVHIWVESIFEFFGVGVISVLLTSMGLVSVRAALNTAYFTAALVFISGIVGTAHHYYWYGGPAFWVGIGSVFSSMEPVPLFGLVVRGLMEYKAIQREGKDFPYRWPMFFLVASSFWNFLGAGVFGFLINLPIVNYYEHGTYLTMNHGHTALFGTYGMLSIALLLFSWRGLVQNEKWNDRLLKVSFLGMNIGLFTMAIGTLLPVGIIQAIVSFTDGLHVARSHEFFLRQDVLFFGKIRAIADLIIILVGVLPLAYFIITTYFHLKPKRIKGSVAEEFATEGLSEHASQ